MATPRKTIRISDDDWKKIGELATSIGISASSWLLLAAKEKAAMTGVTLEGAAPEGNPNIANLSRRGNEDDAE